jgi:hypothetical protein
VADTKQPDQSEKFHHTARHFGCDESEERFDEALRIIAKQKQKVHEPKKREEKV